MIDKTKEFQLDLCRIWKDVKQTLGELSVGEFTGCSLELPDKNNDGIANNEVQQSCIPDGIYPVTKENHKKFGWCFRVHDVPGRSGVLIHSGTNYHHTLGCILPGMDQKDIDGDGLLDNVSSKKALAAMCEYNITSIKIWTRA